MPSHLGPYLERSSLPEGTVLIHQGDPPEDVFVRESGRPRVELETPEGSWVRLHTVHPGAVVGEVAMYTGFTGPPTSSRRRRAWFRGRAGRPGPRRP